MFAHIHADWWVDEKGNEIHRVVVDDEEIFHCHEANSRLPWNCEFSNLREARGYFKCDTSPSTL